MTAFSFSIVERFVLVEMSLACSSSCLVWRGVIAEVISAAIAEENSARIEAATSSAVDFLNPLNIEFKSSLVRSDRVCEVFDMLRGQLEDKETAVVRYY